MLASAWGRIDAPGAFDHVRKRWPQRSVRRMALAELAYEWAMEDPIGAAAAVAALPAGDVTSDDVIPRRLIEGWSQTPDYFGATDYVAGFPRSGVRQVLTTTIATQVLRRHGVDALLTWAESVNPETPGRFRLVAFRKAARVLAQEDPERAAAWVEQRHGDEHTKGVLRIVATQWAEEDPEAAFEWLLARPDDDERVLAIEFAFRDWVRRDPEPAFVWLERRLPDPALDPAVDAGARRLAVDEPPRAAEWATRIEDAERRAAAYEEIGRAWLRRDPEATRAWIEEARLGDDFAEAIQRPASRGRSRVPQAPGVVRDPTVGLASPPPVRPPDPDAD
jgi:hypothetical protein